MLRKFVEIGKNEKVVGRVAYAHQASALPEPAIGLTWQAVVDFNVSDELANPRLKPTIEQAIKHGCAITRPMQ
jgi:hypothetical protein